MKLRRLTLLIATIAGLAGGAVAVPSKEIVHFGCGDLIVVGRLENLSYQHVEFEEEDLLGHGWMTANLKVEESLVGHAPKPILSVKYFGHTYYREDRDFMFVLTPRPEGYLVRKAHFLDGRKPILELASKCEPNLGLSVGG